MSIGQLYHHFRNFFSTFASFFFFSVRLCLRKQMIQRLNGLITKIEVKGQNTNLHFVTKLILLN